MESRRLFQLTPLAVILWVVFLLVMLAGVLIPRFTRPVPSGVTPASRAFAEISNLKTAIDTFEVDCGRVPREDEGLAVLLQAPPDLKDLWAGPYINDKNDKEVPLDPWGHPLRYVRVSEDSPIGFNIISAGPDGIFGTQDDIDINGW